MIRKIDENDADAVCEIYNYYIENTIITFEEQIIAAASMIDRIRRLTKEHPWLVYEQDSQVVGYAYASHWKSRPAYRYSVESTVYLSPDATGQGIASKLYCELIAMLKNSGVHSVIGGIALPNPASVGLHEKMGFEKVAHFKEVGRKFDRWIDVGYWELILSGLINTYV